MIHGWRLLTETLAAQGLRAVQLLDGVLSYERFALDVSQFLVPMLRAGDVLVLDNLALHRIGGLREWLEDALWVAVDRSNSADAKRWFDNTHVAPKTTKPRVSS